MAIYDGFPVTPGAVRTEATKRKAQHRPILLSKFPGGASGPGTSIG